MGNYNIFQTDVQSLKSNYEKTIYEATGDEILSEGKKCD